MIKHCSITISGQVQGVFFRQSAKQKADRLGLTGLVRNEVDGTVYIEIEGDQENLKNFIAWCHQGPEYAKVDRLETHEAKDIKNFVNFTIG